MIINLSEIYAKLEEWRDKHGITAQSQKTAYIVKVMEELGKLATALRNFEKIKNGEEVIKKYIANEWNENNARYAVLRQKKVTLADAEHAIIDALCGIAVFTINAGADIPYSLKKTKIEWEKSSLNTDYILKQMIARCAEFSYFEWDEAKCFNIILANSAYLCEHYGFNFEIAMLEAIKEISTHNADYENARIKK